MRSSKDTRSVVAVSSDDDLLEHLSAFNIWDCICVNDAYPLSRSTRVFGNANIGRLELTNLQVAGQLTSSAAGIVTNWYVRTNIPRSELLDLFLQQTYVTLTLGDRPRWCAPASDLIRWPGAEGPTRSPVWPVVIEDRQNISASVDIFGGVHDDMIRSFENDATRRYVWVHIEGLRIPRELYLHDDESEDSHVVRTRWLKLQAKALRLAAGIKNQPIDTAEYIARWLTQQGEREPSEIQAQLAALADAVREGRWRPENQPHDTQTVMRP